MATNTSAELDAVDCNLGENGLDEFDPEPPRAGSWLRSGVPSAADPSAIDVQDWRLFTAPPRERTWPFAVPVLVAAALVGAAVTWGNIRPSEVATSRRSPAPAPLAAPVVTPAPAPAAEVAPIPAPLEVAPAAAVPNEPARTALDPDIERTLTQVSDAYRALDATALSVVWPGADVPSLSESFSGLKYQALTFERCRVQPNSGDGAMATCDVSIASASKTGDAALQRRRESWTLALSRAGAQWTIAGLTVR